VKHRPPVSRDFPEIRTPWKAIAAELRAAIARGDYDERPKLPSALRLAGDHGVSLGTARKALRSLVDEGLADAMPGTGTFASLAAAGRTPAAGVAAVSAGSVGRQRAASARQVDRRADDGDRAPIDPRGYDLVYAVVAERIEKRIRAGEFGESGRLPRREQLAAHYGVSESSVRKALHSLERRGLVRIMPAKGTFAL
jgi:DNA-binding GntR family transcriptional regulator